MSNHPHWLPYTLHLREFSLFQKQTLVGTTMMRRLVSLGIVVLLLTNISTTVQDKEGHESQYAIVWNFQKKKADISGSQLIQDFFGWHILSGVGLLGTFSNLFLMHCFYAERSVLATSVNAMICMETLHKVIYSSIIVHWRNYTMVSGKPIFEEWLGTSNVRIILFTSLV